MREQDKTDYHLFETDHPLFIELGLGTFTTGTLFSWWNETDHLGRYLNRRLINKVSNPLEKLENPAISLSHLIGFENVSGPEIFWYGWKPGTDPSKVGYFKKQNLRNLSNNAGGLEADEWKYNGATSNTMQDVDSLASKLIDKNPLIGLTLDDNNSATGIFTGVGDYSELQGFGPLYSLLQVNKYMSLFDDFFPRDTWSRSDTNTHPPLSKSEAFGSWALLNEIKAAKSGPYVQWSGDVTFYITENNGLINQCEITENVKFKLYLMDESMMPSSNKSVTVKEIIHVGSPGDRAADGERSSDSEAQVAGEIDLQYNPISKKYQSGNVNILAKLTTDVPPGKAPELAYLLSNNIQETLEDPENTNCYIPGRGSGMPIRTQNSMPLQWSPNYAQDQESRCKTGNTDKFMVPVYNFNPRKYYPSGEEVLLTLIDEVWHVSDLGQSDIPETGVVETGIGKWGPFTYFATNTSAFFKGDINVSGFTYTKSVSPREAELNFHKIYYSKVPADYQLNFINGDYGPVGDQTTGIEPSGGYNYSEPFNTSNHLAWTPVHGCFQTTSFDYLDSQIYGIRGMGGNEDTCAIASTSATLNSAGKVIPSEENYANRNSAHTGAFFGCVFPQGYQGTDIYDNVDRANNFSVQSTEIGKYEALDYFNIAPNTARKNPFENSQQRSASNAKCNATVADPYAEINPEDGGNNWNRANTIQEANMFYLGLSERRRTIPADVMLNASPSGKYGSPIKPLGLYRDLDAITNSLVSNGQQFNNLIVENIYGGCWLYKQKVNSDSDLFESAFDFQPFARDNLMFRPLKLEAYLMLGAPPLLQTGEEVPYFTDKSLDSCQKDINVFSTEAAKTTVNGRWPISYHTYSREQDNSEAIKYNHNGQKVLGWGAWTKFKPNYGRLHKYNYWNTGYGALQWTTGLDAVSHIYRDSEGNEITENGNWAGAGAFGVITTNLKVSANSKIEFVTSNIFGMGAGAHGQFTLAGQPQDRTWGVSNFIDSYKQENIIDLSVRIYQGHPEDQTIYDPRYFAVHHFNPGVRWAFDRLDGAETIPVNEDGHGRSIPRNYLKENFKTFRDNEGDLLDNVYYFYPQASGVDIKVPSRYNKFLDNVNSNDTHEEDGEYEPERIAGNTFIFKDLTFDGEAVKPPLMPEQYWLVDTKRTGKLLPYRYTSYSIGSPFSIGQELTLGNGSYIPESENSTKQIKEVKDKLIYKNTGTGYVIGDAVGNLDYKLILEVTDTYNDGSISAVKVLSAGEDMQFNILPNSDDIIGEFTPNSNLKLNTLTGNGQGFDAYFVSMKMQIPVKCDKKPYLIKRNGIEINRIAANQPGPNHSTYGRTPDVEGAAFVNQSETTTYTIPEELKSSDGTYDIFFHFHNDISFNWIAGGNRTNNDPHGDFSNATECTEQHVTIEGISLE